MTERDYIAVGSHTVLLVDSVSYVEPDDAAMVIVTGSHGGVSAGRYAASVRARLYVFNDAGVGKDEAGIAGLALLEQAGIAACTVGHNSARIGEAADTLEHGVISHANALATAAGFAPSRPLRLAIAEIP